MLILNTYPDYRYQRSSSMLQFISSYNFAEQIRADQEKANMTKIVRKVKIN